eukprot:COSAG02_NODE_56100_length_287_cov_0.808511_1_plen_41_part_10
MYSACISGWSVVSLSAENHPDRDPPAPRTAGRRRAALRRDT